jgi:hypothetical protein
MRRPSRFRGLAALAIGIGLAAAANAQPAGVAGTAGSSGSAGISSGSGAPGAAMLPAPAVTAPPTPQDSKDNAYNRTWNAGGQRGTSCTAIAHKDGRC